MSRLHYASLCWGFNTKRVFKLQKKAVRIISKSKYNSHTDPIFRKLKLLKMNDIFNSKCLTFYFRYVQGTLPRFFDDIFRSDPNTHTYNTRHRIPNYQRPNTESAKKTIRYFIPSLIRTTPEDIMNKMETHSLQNIKFRVKLHYIDSYQLTCEKRHCYVCNT